MSKEDGFVLPVVKDEVILYKDRKRGDSTVKNLKFFYYPDTLQGAVKLLKEQPVKTEMIAGGTSVALSRDTSVEALVDITRLGLNYIKVEGGYVKIGATTPLQQIGRSRAANKLANGIVSQCAMEVASRPLRNVITLGGNIVKLKTWTDMPTVLLCLDAQIKIQEEEEEEKIIPAEDFFKQYPKKFLKPHHIVTEIIFPMTMENSGGAYCKFSKTKGDYAIVSVGCYIEVEEGACSLARVAIGSASPLPSRCVDAEILLEGKPLEEKLIKQAAKLCRDSAKTVDSLWGSARYRSILVERLVTRALTSCMEKINANK